MKKKNFCYALMAASAVLTLGSAMTSFADWKVEDGGWIYEENNGEWAKNTWKPSGDRQCYLGDDGYMAANTLLNIDESYYYVNSSGYMSVNEWRLLQNPEWQGDELVDEGSWYYFGSNGRAYTSKNGETKLFDIGGKKYAFDAYGRMMTGWISDGVEYVPEEEWQNAVYYGDGDGDGSIVTNAWVITAVQDEDNEDESDPTYHFYFSSNGKKVVNTDKTIGDKKYHFDERGVSTYGWISVDNGTWRYYGDMEEPYLRTGWFQATPDSQMNSSGHDDGSVYWYFASSRGDISISELKTIDGKSYGFNGNGELITGLKKITVTEGDKKKIESVASVNNLDDIPTTPQKNVSIIYFASGDGAVKTGTQTISLDDGTYTFSFSPSGSPKGAGENGIKDGYIYTNGRRLSAEEDTKYQIVSWSKDEESEAKDYVLNESGSIQKNKKNLKDADGYYYCTNSDGTLRHGPLDDRCDGKEGH